MKRFGFTRRMAGVVAVVSLCVMGSINEGKAGEFSLVGDYPVTVDCTKPLSEMFNMGLYGYIDPDIASGIPPIGCSGRTNITITVLRFDKIFHTSMEAIMLLGKQGCRPATIAELIALDNAHHEVLVLHC